MSGTLTFSLEIELGWGFKDKPEEIKKKISNGGKMEIEYLKKLINILDKYEIPFTFNLIGGLLENSAFSSILEDNRCEIDQGEFEKYFYAPEVLSIIKNAKISHDIGTHTYTHILSNENGNQDVDSELSRVENVFDENGLKRPISFVAPRHQEISKKILRKHGIKVMRRPIYNYKREDNIISKLGIFTRIHPLTNSKLVDGIIETTCTPSPSLTAGFLPNGKKSVEIPIRYIPTRMREYLHKRYLKRSLNNAIRKNGELHLWSHLFNLSNPEQWRPLKDFFKYVKGKMDVNQLKVKTMADLVKDYELEG